MWGRLGLCIGGLLGLVALIVIGFAFRFRLPSYIHIYLALLITICVVLGEVFGFFDTYPWFNKVLHTISGALITVIGFTIARWWLGGELFEKSPLLFIAFFAFCFSLMVGVFWEIMEFTVDCVAGQNMQRWQDPNSVRAPFESGLIDTMWDMIVHTIAALVISVIGYFYLRKKRKESK